MPDSAIVSALTSLIPSLPASNKPFPPLLLLQAESLLALSRQRASNLKPEEEIARPHACAEIACNRLRAQLRLPAIKNGAGAPCQPRVYAKLLRFFEGALVDANTGSLTPRWRKRDGDGNLKEPPSASSTRQSATSTPSKQGLDVEDTPTKKRTVDRNPGAQFAGTIKAGRKKQSEGGGLDGDDKAPRFVMPAIRKLCGEFSTSSLAPHVYTGTCVVLKLAELWDSETEADDALRFDILTLITALYLMVLTRMQEGQMTTEVYTEVTSKSIDILKIRGEGMAKVEEWISRLNEEGWCNDEDWWDSVPESVLVFGAEQDQPTVDDGDNGGLLRGKQRPRDSSSRPKDVDKDDPDGVLLPGLGTMLHDGIDWTSEDRCMDYQEWKARIMKIISVPGNAAGRKGKAVAVN